MKNNEPACHSCCEEKPPFWQNRLFQVALLYLAVFILALFFPLLKRLEVSLLLYLKLLFFPVLIGLLLGGLIDWLVPQEYISLLLAGQRKRSIVFAVICGFLMTACSHGILAISMQLYKKGASTAAVVAFLLASPWANLPLTIMMFGFFGLKALLIVFGAILIALISGYIYLFMEKRGAVEVNPNTVAVDPNFSLADDARKRFKAAKFSFPRALAASKAVLAGSLSLANMILWWILIGVFLSAFTAAYLPSGFLYQYMGPTFIGLLVTLAVATVLEVCSEGSAPLAFEIFRQTGAFGNSFTFLMAGVVTDYTEIGLIWTNIGWRAAVWLPIVTVPQVLILALLFNAFF